MNTISDTDVLAAKDVDSENAIDRVLVLEMVRVTEAAAVAAGFGPKPTDPGGDFDP